MLEKTGVPTPAQVEAVKPSPERLTEGPVVIVECFQEIPCDPCYTACKRGGFLPFADINDLPRMDFAKCNGCGICIVKGLNREGDVLADVEVKKVRSAGSHNQTSILTLIVPKKYAHDIRSIRVD